MPSVSVDAIIAATQARPPTAGRTRLVCVDGPAGSGKTTLAAELGRGFATHGLTVATLHMDDFYHGWEGLRPDLEHRLVEQVMGPLAAGRPAHWQRYDWTAGRYAEWQDLDPTDVLVLEGCGSGARAYDPYRAVLVWVEAPRAVRIQRGLERDGAEAAELWLAWMEAEERHFAANSTRERADVSVRT